MEIIVFKRLLTLPQEQSFFLFGARATGKSTLLSTLFSPQKSLWIDLLNPVEEDKFAREPLELEQLVLSLPKSVTHVVIDEVQKLPRLLDVVHRLMLKTDKSFVMTGSSARKLKRGGANLLAGRAYVYHLHPFSFVEVGEQFDLSHALNWGLLPQIFLPTTNKDKVRFLQSYAYTYLKEEIAAEQLVRRLDPFRRFLEVAAQCNGKIINYSQISRDVGVDDKTVQEYFSTLEDTLIGFFLEPFLHSFRKRLSHKPKFYFFDLGVTKALARTLTLELRPSTSAYGEAFEHFIILEALKLASYFKPEYRFSYIRTKDDMEIDLVVERPGQPLLLIEIKSSRQVREEDLKTLAVVAKDLGGEAICLSNDLLPKTINDVQVLPWQQGLSHFFGVTAN